MDFKETNDSVIAFYEEFYDTFSKIDQNFDKLDELGGIDFSTARTIITSLREYHNKVYCNTELTTDRVERFDELEQQLRKELSFADLSYIVKTLQEVVHDFLVYETQWPGQNSCIRLISQILEVFHKTAEVQQTEQHAFYTAIRILRELVADCSISIRGLTKLSPWSYGTKLYSKLDANSQLVVLLNQAILTDRMYFCLHSLEITLVYLNKVVNSFDELDWSVYYTVGFLNFKVHQYKDAIRCFEYVIKNDKLKNAADQSARKRYFHANLLLAYCYEYNHDFAQAIRVLAIEPERIVELIESKPFNSLETDFGIIMEEIVQSAKSAPLSLVAQYFNSYSEFEQHAQQPSRENSMALDMQFEILHAFAHCLNEYSIKNNTNRPAGSTRNYGRCIRFARLVMKRIAFFRTEFATCYATIHGECKDYHIALLELDNAERKLTEGTGKKESLIAEISFFRYYFNMLCNRASSKDKAFFEEYAQKCDDDDAKCHVKIFEFREELRRFISVLFECIYKLIGDMPFTENSIIGIPDELKVKYNELCGLEPTLYMNASVRTELRLMQRAYNCIEYLREYLIHPNAKNLLVLQNACYRFSIIKHEFHHSSELLSDQLVIHGDVFPDSLPDVVKAVFSVGESSILSSLYSTDSIFILAPISGVVVFQYQTGTIQKLFDDDSIFPEISQTEASKDDVDAIANSIFEIYNGVSQDIGIREMDKVDWNSLSKYTDIIYHWSNNVPTQVLVCENGKTSYVRQIVDEAAFSKVIFEAKKCLKDDGTRRLCIDSRIRKRNKTLKCTLQKTKIPWLEIVNEGEPRDFYIAWDDHDTLDCFMVPLKNVISKHELHQSIRTIEIIYPQFSSNPYEYAPQDMHEVTAVKTDPELARFAKEICAKAKAKKAETKREIQKLLEQRDDFANEPNGLAYKTIDSKVNECISHESYLDQIVSYTEGRSDELSREKLQEYQCFLTQLRKQH